MKSVEFVGSSREDLQAFPANARSRAGHELYLLQDGEEPSDFKPMPSVGAGAYEIRLRSDSGAFRVIYVAKFRSAVYVLHAFQKKSQKTSPADIRIAAQRYRLIEVKP